MQLWHKPRRACSLKANFHLLQFYSHQSSESLLRRRCRLQVRPRPRFQAFTPVYGPLELELIQTPRECVPEYWFASLLVWAALLWLSTFRPSIPAPRGLCQTTQMVWLVMVAIADYHGWHKSYCPSASKRSCAAYSRQWREFSANEAKPRSK